MLPKIEKYYRRYYKRFRDKYLPEEIKYIFVTQSPPVSGQYFYKDDGKASDPLYYAMMKCILKQNDIPAKTAGLKLFRDNGFFLIDSCCLPLDKLDDELTKEAILNVAGNLSEDLEQYFKPHVKTVLVANNVFAVYHNKEFVNKYNVINRDTIIPFPGKNQRNFCITTNKVLGCMPCKFHQYNS